MHTEVTFSSRRFAPVLPEECQVNPTCYGYELCDWLCRQLAQRGVTTSYPNFEDWGWFIEFAARDGDEFWLCCGNIDAGTDRWRCFLEPKRKGLLVRRKAAPGAAEPLMVALREVIEADPDIVGVVWSNPER